ncbi:arylsulfotransferase family protein [Ruegeria sp. HKCCA6837]|uniref:arylsulfotransferase family protein n=1 Tax=Ruegeria sp. HKCCA6837 TaxID=2682989 RepID=UPI001489DF2F|nr:arylsulfotransferase family protein [Ruegeria sp. HKCCA6837]
MEKLLLKKIELWVLGLVLVASFVGMILFGAIVLDEERGEEELGGDNFGALGDVALAMAELPENTRQALKKVGRPDPTMATFLRIPAGAELPDGWSWVQSPGTDGLDGYLLFSRYDGTQTRHVVELISLKTGEILRTWSPEPDVLLADVERRPEFDGYARYDEWNNTYFRYIHPYLTEDGDLLLKNHLSPLFLLSPCGDIRWSQDEHLFHHSTNPDGEGGFWMPSVNLGPRPKNLSRGFVRDSVARVNAEGEVVFEATLDDIFYNSGLRHLLFPAAYYHRDPMHLNDIEPVLADGPHWQKGDLFLSFRSPSLVALYRPSAGTFVWWQAGPWQSQHDIDILDDHRIAVFNNNAYNRGLGARVEGVSETVIYDFETGLVTSPYRETMERFSVATVSEGLQDFTPSGHLIFEEENRGRMFVLNAAGDVVATFVNRAENGETYRLGWSRYITQLHGDKALTAIAESGC